MLEEYDFTNARKNPYIQREGGAADEQADEHSRLAGSLQPVACGGKTASAGIFTAAFPAAQASGKRTARLMPG